MIRKDKPEGLREVTVMGMVTLEVAFDWRPAEPETGLPEEYEITEVWVGDQEITDTPMAESVEEDIIEYLQRERKREMSLVSQMKKAPRMYREEAERIDRLTGCGRGIWPREVF